MSFLDKVAVTGGSDERFFAGDEGVTEVDSDSGRWRGIEKWWL